MKYLESYNQSNREIDHREFLNLLEDIVDFNRRDVDSVRKLCAQKGYSFSRLQKNKITINISSNFYHHTDYIHKIEDEWFLYVCIKTVGGRDRYKYYKLDQLGELLDHISSHN